MVTQIRLSREHRNFRYFIELVAGMTVKTYSEIRIKIKQNQTISNVRDKYNHQSHQSYQSISISSIQYTIC